MSDNQRTDRLEERIADLEKRCALLEKHYAPAEHNPASPRFLELERFVERLAPQLTDAAETADDAMDQATAAREELADMQCVLLEELGLEDEAESAEELAQRAVREIRQLKSELVGALVERLRDLSVGEEDIEMIRGSR